MSEPKPDNATLADLECEIVSCFRCPRLVAWRELVAREKRAAYADQHYWGRPVPGFGDPRAHLIVVGLAPAAHGGNRTGRVFTGDRSGEWLFRAMYRAGYANQPQSTHRGDGLELDGAWVCAAVRCAPPDNKPLPQERTNCLPYLERELDLLGSVDTAVVLGKYGYESLWRCLASRGDKLPVPRPKFGHGVEVETSRLTIVCSFHPSQQNTFTRRLTEPMLDSVFHRARDLQGHRRGA